MLAYVNGKYVPETDACVPLADHGFLFGDGVYETMRVYQGNIFAFAEHIERLQASMQAIHIVTKWSLAELKDIATQLINSNNLSSGRLRLMVTRGTGSDIVIKNDTPNLYVLAHAIDEQRIRNLQTKGVKVVLVERSRPLAEVKSINFLTSVLAKTEAYSHDAHEALFINKDGYLLEGTTSNFFLVKHGQVVTPAKDILYGITRGKVITLCKELKIDIIETTVTKADLKEATEVFLTSSVHEIIPVLRIGDQIISTQTGTVTKELINAYHGLVAQLGR